MASTIKATNISTPDGTGNITVDRPLSGSGASLTALNATNLASGTVPTARLGSGTASSSNFLRGDGSWQTAGGGKVLQVVTDLHKARESFSSTTKTAIDSGWTANITPASTSSRIRIDVYFHFYISSNSPAVAGGQLQMTVYRGGSDVQNWSSDGSGTSTWQQSLWTCFTPSNGWESAGFTYIDSPNTTSQCTYQPYWWWESGTAGNNTILLGQSNNADDNLSLMILTEIGA